MSASQRFFITCSKGVEDLLLGECERQGITTARTSIGGVEFDGTLEQAYSMCMWSRVGSRVLLRLCTEPVDDDDELYQFALRTDWATHFEADSSIAIDCATSHEHINNNHFASLRIKDAIVDQMRERFGNRPDIDKQRPDVRINAYISKTDCTLYIDLTGEPLHRRGYRLSTAQAPLRETLAAAMLYRCKWPAKAEQGASFADIMCGSGTLLIEAAAMAAHIAPSLARDYFGFLNWKQHDAQVWQNVVEQAESCIQPLDTLPVIVGFEKSHRTLDMARDNIEAAGFEQVIELKQSDSLTQTLALPETPGLMLTNPPYGKRLGDIEQLKDTYFRIGMCLKQQFAGWTASLITSEDKLAQCVGLRAHHKNTLYNGALRCTLYQYRMRVRQDDAPALREPGELHENALTLKNRLQKNLKHLKKWAKQNEVSCYRIYDADLPQYAVAIDIYDGEYVVQEYQAPKKISAGRALQHLNDVIEVLQQVFDCDRDSIIIKTRKKQAGSAQYTSLNATKNSRRVTEDGLLFRINLHDYLDTGLFLDHRTTRKLVRRLSSDRKVLNLFAYTGSFSVYAVAGGAEKVTTVDMSNTYLDWAKWNFEINDMDTVRHNFVRADCLVWMQQVSAKYDIIILDPPTFSNSKKMEEILDINRDHVSLIKQAMSLLSEQGLLLFSCNAKGFRMDTAALSSLDVRDITSQTTTEDFRRKPAHKCWCITRDGVQVDVSV